MSTYEQWAAMCELNEDARADVERRADDYRGCSLKASVRALPGGGQAMRVCITRHGSGRYREVVQVPDWPVDRFADPDAALDALLDHGRAIIDGRVPGLDVTKLLG